MNKLKEELASVSQVDQEPSLEGRQLINGSLSKEQKKLIKLLWDINLKTHSGASKDLKKRSSINQKVQIEIIFLQSNQQNVRDIIED